MRSVNVREMRQLLPDIEQELRREGELILTKRDKAVARIVPMPSERPRRPSNAEFRASMPFQEVPSEVLIREDRDARD